MKLFLLSITPQSAFSSELFGDTLFGQLCWAIRNRKGEKQLEALLKGYAKQPFVVVSNAFPRGFVPRPELPACYFNPVDDHQLKTVKKQQWLPLATLKKPLQEWQNDCKANDEVGETTATVQIHNTLNRLTDSTGVGIFAPYITPQYWYPKGMQLDIYVLLDLAQCDPDEIKTYFEDIGQFGYGRDASIGQGKYDINTFEATDFYQPNESNACLTLAPCAPQGLGFNAKQSFYQLFTRFGRHGDRAAYNQKSPFKSPILMTKAGAVFSTPPAKQGFIGQSLGGNGELSNNIIGTVHQGYAPFIAFHLPSNTTGTE